MQKRFPVSPAILHLKEKGVEYKEHLYDYRKKGAEAASKQLSVDNHKMIKTLIMQDEKSNPFIVLMHGDREVSTKNLARRLSVKRVNSNKPRAAERMTGYLVGGISPFGIKKDLPIYVEESILELGSFFVNAGRRGFLVELTPEEFKKATKYSTVNVARKSE
jgi:Cys-tRNA(Pro) deacylase